MEILLVPFKKYAVFSGRANRKEYWVFFLFCVFVGTVLSNTIDLYLVNARGFGFNVTNTIFTLATLIPWIAVGVRRLHDADFSGWWLLIGLIPLFGTIASLIMLALPSTKGENKYGPEPTTK